MRFLKALARIVAKVPVILVIIGVFLLGYWYKGVVQRGQAYRGAEPAQVGEPDAAEEIWTCSMHPQIRLPHPGQCPICGMDLIPAETAPAGKPTAKKPVRYACAMLCLPPMDKPGRCPVCGMDMVPVEEGDAVQESRPRELTLSPTAQKLADIQVAPVERKFVSADIRMVGKVEYDETRVKHITAWVPGRLDRLFVDYTGIPVKEGDHLVYMYSPELATAQEEFFQALRAVKDLSRSQLPGARESAARTLEAARERFALWGLTEQQIEEIERRGTASDHMTIYSPIGGIVIHKNAVEGMYVDTGTRIYTIADLNQVWVKLDAYESDLRWLRYGQKVEFETEAYPGDIFTGKIAFIDPTLDPKTRTVKVRVNVPNTDGRLKPEMFVHAVAHVKVAEGGKVLDTALAGKWISPMHPEVVKDGPGTCDVCGMPLVRAESLGYVSMDPGEARAPLVIPASAPLITGKRAVVYVADPDGPGTYEGREVVLGPRANGHYLVQEGLAEGERVVINGNFKIDSAIQILARPSMMSPEGGAAASHGHGDHEPTTVSAPSKEQTHMPEKGPGHETFEVPHIFRLQLDAVFSAYFDLHHALSRDDLKKARNSARVFRATLDTVEGARLPEPARPVWAKEQKGLKESAEAIIDQDKSSDIEAVRSRFALLSESLAAVAQRFGASGRQPIRLFHCPMAFNNRGANWLQETKKTENPYFGAAMFRCGVLKETIDAGLGGGPREGGET